MVRHIVLFKTKPGADPAQVDHMVDAFRALPGSVDYVRNLAIGHDVSHRGSFNMAWSCDFASTAELERFRSEEAHRRIVSEYVTPLCEDQREVVDYEY